MTMRPFLFVFLAAIILSGCSKDIQSNSPAMQGNLDNVFFKAFDARAEKNEDDSYTIQGTNSNEVLTLRIDKAELKSYPLGQGQPNFMTYEDEDGNLYHSSPNGGGTIELTDRCISCGWLTGTFQGTLILPGIDTITVDRGVFYEVSFLEGGIIGDDDGGNEGDFRADVDGVEFFAVTVDNEVSNGSLIITGAIGDRNIRIVVPVNTAAGAFSIATPGYEASYNDGLTNEVAESGVIDVIFNTGSQTRIRFNFITENHVINHGRTWVQY